MTPAESAVNNAISFECKKDALQQRQSGDWKISFTVQGVDMDERITRAPMGTRFVAVLVAINDDELPIPLAEKEKAKAPHDILPATPRRLDKPAGAKRDWRDLQPAQQAGIRCNEPTFISYLKENYPSDWRESDGAAECVRLICRVNSRAELGINHTARILWFDLDTKYQAWLAMERVGS